MSETRDLAGTWCSVALLFAALASLPVAAFSGPGWPLFGLQAACAGMMVICALPVLAVGEASSCLRSAAITLVAAAVGYVAEAPAFVAIAVVGALLSLSAYVLRPTAVRTAIPH